MKSAAKVLVIDDLFGAVVSERRNLCKAYRLVDITGDDTDAVVLSDPPVARAVFCSGQVRVGNTVRNSVETVMAAVQTGWPDEQGHRWALCLLDLRFVSDDGRGGGDDADDDFGLVVLEHLHRAYPDLPIIILSSRERAEVIQACRRLGASEFIQRHESLHEKPYAVLARKLHEFGLIADDRSFIVGGSLPLLRALAAARRAATGTGNILLLGESGTGKELAARYIHQNSPRCNGPYKVFDAFGTAESLQEDLLFGHEKGAFTGANRERRGLFEEADQGTLFIDEVGDISASIQNRLLRPIESRSVVRQGSTREIMLSYQLVLATNKDLDDYARTERFRSDLLNRINAYTIWLPPLRERQEDIPMLVRAMLERLCLDSQLRWPREVDSKAMDCLVAHDWRDGNVRELRSVLERAVKDNPQSELLVASDLRIGTTTHPLPPRGLHKEAQVYEAPTSWPVGESYEDLFGCWPLLQREVAERMFAKLHDALRATARRSAHDGSAKPNLAGAVGCLLGRKVSTVEAADFVKRLHRFDPDVAADAASRHALLAETLRQAHRARRVGVFRIPRAGEEV